MWTNCPVCGLSNVVNNVCQTCDTDISKLITAPPPNTCPLADSQIAALTLEETSQLKNPWDSLVVTTNDQRHWRIHWIPEQVWHFWQPHVHHRLSCHCAALPEPQLITMPSGQWLACEISNRDVSPWTGEKSTTIMEDLRHMQNFLLQLAATFTALHETGLVWLNYHPQFLEWSRDGKHFVCKNMDIMAFPTGRNNRYVLVHPSYVAPEIWNLQETRLTHQTDVFHLGLTAYYWLANLLPDGFAGRGLPAFHFQIPPLRPYCPHLPTRIESCLRNCFSRLETSRPPTIQAFLDDLDYAIGKCEQRASSEVAVEISVGWKSHTGIAKAALQRQNEDFVCIQQFANPERQLLAVADGISICQIGNGALASRLTCMVLENGFSSNITEDQFAEKLVECCYHAGETILGWALDQGYLSALKQGKQLMGSTLTAAWIQDNRLQIGNLGDSRVYLCEQDHIEQLTVDGDLKSALLAMHLPPEEIQLMGNLARALQYCVGGYQLDESGQPVVDPTICVPAITNWKIVPGDVLVLCTDGLVDEGFFLEPAEVLELVRENEHLPVQEIADRLVTAANNKQRLPSSKEKQGFGDNISVIVVKVIESQITS